MRELFLFTLFAFFIANTGLGQNSKVNSYIKGYIVTKSDTINCYIEKQKAYKEHINYKYNYTDRKPFSFNCEQIVSLKDSCIYDNISYKSESHLMQRLYAGEVKFYKHTIYDEAMRYNPATGINSRGHKFELINYYIVFNNQVHQVNSFNFKRKMRKIFELEDKQEILEKLNTLDKKNMEEEIVKFLSDVNQSPLMQSLYSH